MLVGATLTVSPTGSGDCTNTPCSTMQEAIAAANSGDTIQLAAGTYQGSGFREQIINAKDLTIIGAGIDQTIIDLENEG